MLINVLSSKCWNFMFWFATHHTQLFDYFAKKNDFNGKCSVHYTLCRYSAYARLLRSKRSEMCLPLNRP